MSSPSHALDGLGTMPRTIQCPQCGVVLNVPEAAAGRRLKCPKCATKFSADGGPPPPGPASSTTLRARGAGLSFPGSSIPPSEPDMPVASGSLREQFDLPLLSEDTPAAARPAAQGDVSDLFREDPPGRRKTTQAEARSRDRRCPTCGGVVPRGMSLCSTCGLDLETGRRIDLTEEIEVPAPMRRPPPPLGAYVVGGLSIFVAVLFAIISLLRWSGGETGYLFLFVVCLFGIYAAAQFLRGKSLRLLFVALTLGVGIDIIAMIILPVVLAMSDVEVNQQDPDGPAIQSATERLDTQKLSWGVAIVVSYAAVAIYLNSPPVRRRFR
jgi:hypothetical protein